MQMFTLGKNHNDIPEEDMSKHISLLLFSDQAPARVCRESGYVKMQESQLSSLALWCTPEVSYFHVFPSSNTRDQQMWVWFWICSEGLSL